MPPASRIGDNHTCPMVNPGPAPHVGGPILTGFATVLIGNKPAARVSDKAMCQAPPDSISMGATNVLVGNKMAARIGDPTAHGGVVVQGLPTVLIGTQPQGAVLKAAAKSGVAFCEECARRKAEAQKKALQKKKPPARNTAAAHAAAATPATARPAAPGAPRLILASYAPPAAGGGFNVDAAVAHADAHARAASQGRCGAYVRGALNAGGAGIGPLGDAGARALGPGLERAGFTEVADRNAAGYAPRRGDVVVFQAIPGHPNGHAAIYNGSQWVSDYRQPGFYANQSYRSGEFSVYRPPSGPAPLRA